jgi:hypothetical protein
MKKYRLLAIVLFSGLSNAQDIASNLSTVEKNLFSVQLGLGNFSFQNETRLFSKVALRSELGLTLGVSVLKSDNPTIEDKTTTIVAPYITAEPRWYYNIDDRSKRGKTTKGNSANYISLQTRYRANSSPIIHNGEFDIVSDVSIIPKVGIRRTYSTFINYEFSIGTGYQYNIFSSRKGCNCSHNSTALDLQARIGYNF